MKKGDKYIVVTSDEPWNDIWMPQLHYAYQLSKRFNVIFLGPPKPWKFSSLFNFNQNTRKINDRLIVVDYLNLLPLSLGKFAVFVDDMLNQIFLKRMMNISPSRSNLIMWRFDPIRSFYQFRNKKSAIQLFHVIDPIAGSDFDVPLSINADLVVITSPRLANHYHALNSNVIQIGQGVDRDFYKGRLPANDEEIKNSKDSIVLLGTLTDDIDFIFLKRIALHFKNNLILIGPDKVFEEQKQAEMKDLLNLTNVFWLGPMHPQAFRIHLDVCKVGIIAYDNIRKEANKLRSPLKAIAYLAAGKNIISNIDCEIPGLINNAIFITENHDEFIKLIERSMVGDLNFNHESVSRFFGEINYDYLLKKIFEKLGEPLPKPIDAE